jgi:hypothetical protein
MKYFGTFDPVIQHDFSSLENAGELRKKGIGSLLPPPPPQNLDYICDGDKKEKWPLAS